MAMLFALVATHNPPGPNCMSNPAEMIWKVVELRYVFGGPAAERKKK